MFCFQLHQQTPQAVSFLFSNLFIFWHHGAACVILVPPPPGIESASLKWKHQVLTTEPPGKS